MARPYRSSVFAAINHVSAPVDAPEDLNADDLTDTTVSLSWSPVAGASSYDVYYAPHGGSYTRWENTGGLLSTITGLTYDTEYDVKVRARNAGGEGPFCTELTFFTRWNPLSDPQCVQYCGQTSQRSVNNDGTGGTPVAGTACGQWFDQTSNGNHISAYNNTTGRPTFNTVPNRLTFDGSNHNMSSCSSVVLTGGYYIFMRAKYTGTAGNKAIWGRWGSPNQTALLLNGISDATKTTTIIRNSTDSANQSVETPRANDGNYHCIYGGYDQANNLAVVGIDGTEATAAATSINAGTGNCATGSYVAGAGGLGLGLACDILVQCLVTGNISAAKRARIADWVRNYS